MLVAKVVGEAVCFCGQQWGQQLPDCRSRSRCPRVVGEAVSDQRGLLCAVVLRIISGSFA